MDRQLLAKRLDDFRKQRNMTYEKLEDVTKIPTSTLYRYLKNPPKTPDPDIVDTIARATGHTKEEAYEGLEDLPTSTGEYVAEVTAAETEQLKEELESERKLQHSLSNKIDSLIEVFRLESKKNDAMLEELRSHNDELNARLTKTHTALDEAHKDAAQERKRKTGWTIAAAVLAVLLSIIGMYALYAFLAFDLPDPAKGIWPPHW